MTLTKINSSRFKEICQAHRETFDPEYWMSFRQSLKIDLDETPSWKLTREWEVRQYNKPKPLPTEADHYTAYWNAAQRAYLQGASEGQCHMLARLSAEHGEFSVFDGILTEQEASRLIAAYRNER